MRRPGGPVLLLALACAVPLAAVACRAVEPPFGARDAMGRPAADESPDAWRYVIDADVQAVATPADPAGVALPAGLRAAVVERPGLPGTAEAHAAVEGVAVPVPLGEATWGNEAYRSPATLAPLWTGARVAVEWVVLLRRRAGASVEVEAVPRLLHASGAVALLHEFRVVRRVNPDDALVLSLDPRHPAARDVRALFGARAAGAPAGAPLRLALRVRGGA
jgi:hypothetical protein